MRDMLATTVGGAPDRSPFRYSASHTAINSSYGVTTWSAVKDGLAV